MFPPLSTPQLLIVVLFCFVFPGTIVFSPLFVVVWFSFLFCFGTCFFCAHREVKAKAQTKLRQPQQYLRTASTAEQLALDPAQSSKAPMIPQYVRVDQTAEFDS